MNKGFSLIELLVTLAIIAILAAIAYPSYSAHIIKTHRAQAKVALMGLAANMEQYHVLNNTYQGATIAKLNANDKTEKGFYHLEIASANRDNFLIRAIPDATQKDSCGILSLDQAGEKRVSGVGNVTDCW